jgi:hypothetical protein
MVFLACYIVLHGKFIVINILSCCFVTLGCFVMSETNAFWESNLQKEQERAELDVAGANDAGSSSDDELPILATLATKKKKKIMPHVASRGGEKPSPKAKKTPKKPHPRWVYVPVIPEQDVSSQYWDTLPSAVRVARDAANLKVHTCMEAAYVSFLCLSDIRCLLHL